MDSNNNNSNNSDSNRDNSQSGSDNSNSQGGNNQSGGNQGSGGNNPNADPNYQPATTGGVIDPENDGRLKENREEGRTKGTTEHSSKAPHVDQDNSGSVNADSERPAQETYQGNQSGGRDGSDNR